MCQRAMASESPTAGHPPLHRAEITSALADGGISLPDGDCCEPPPPTSRPVLRHGAVAEPPPAEGGPRQRQDPTGDDRQQRSGQRAVPPGRRGRAGGVGPAVPPAGRSCAAKNKRPRPNTFLFGIFRTRAGPIRRSPFRGSVCGPGAVWTALQGGQERRQGGEQRSGMRTHSMNPPPKKQGGGGPGRAVPNEQRRERAENGCYYWALSFPSGSGGDRSRRV